MTVLSEWLIVGNRVNSKRRNKYHAKRVFEDGIMFDSKWEHKRYRELRLLQRAGEITELEVHPSYPIVWPESEMVPFRDEFKICTVILDFKYVDGNGKVIVEDTKGMRTALSNLKLKLVEVAHGIKVDLIVGRV